jgi:hypothetical protein
VVVVASGDRLCTKAKGIHDVFDEFRSLYTLTRMTAIQIGYTEVVSITPSLKSVSHNLQDLMQVEKPNARRQTCDALGLSSAVHDLGHSLSALVYKKI